MSKQPALSQHKITVLLVDDQPLIGEAVRRMLAGESDIVFQYCKDPTKAIATADKVQPTVILQDLVMPEIDGLELVKRFRAHETTLEVPIIVLSTKEEAATKAEAFALGGNDYIVKLPDRLELLAHIRHHSKGYINLLQRNEAFQALVESQRQLANDVEEAAHYVRSLLPEKLVDGKVKADWRFVPSAALGGDTFGYDSSTSATSASTSSMSWATASGRRCCPCRSSTRSVPAACPTPISPTRGRSSRR